MKFKITDQWKGPTVAIGTVEGGRCEIVTATGREDAYETPQELMMAYQPSHFWIVSEPDGWELALDPFHPEAFKGMPAESIMDDPGPRSVVWLALDAWGNAVGVAGVRDLHPPRKPGYAEGKGFPRMVACDVCEEGFLSEDYAADVELVCPRCRGPVSRVMLVAEREAKP